MRTTRARQPRSEPVRDLQQRIALVICKSIYSGNCGCATHHRSRICDAMVLTADTVIRAIQSEMLKDGK